MYHNLNSNDQARCKRIADNEIFCRAPESLIELDFEAFFDNLHQSRRNEETLNFWFVSSWFADKLIRCQETVCENFHGLYIWSNTSGGALYSHPALVAIATYSIEDYVERLEDEDID